MRGPVAIALDAPDLATLQHWAHLSGPHAQVMKVGLEAFLRDGAAAVDAARDASGSQIFLDLKLHDIPNTVAGACRSIGSLRPDYLTVHAAGGPEMVQAAAQTLPDTRITAVTILTSLSAEDLELLGITATPSEAAVRMASVAVQAGARAIVCSPHEVAAIRSVVPQDIVLITPGVRPAGAATGDQQRVATPASAISSGADLIVVGRPITGAPDIAAAAAAIAAEAASAVTARASAGH
jgi:orotidine-5'-phosphate decarboxylase